MHHLGTRGADGEAREGVGVRADGEGGNFRAAEVDGVHVLPAEGRGRLVFGELGEGGHVALGLHAHEIVAREVAHELAMMRNGVKRVGRGEGDVEVEAQPIPDPKIAQFGRQRNEVVVVDPDHVVGAQQRQKSFGELAVHRR